MEKIAVFFILILLTSCASTVKREYKGAINYSEFKEKLDKNLPTAQINKLDSNKAIELEAWNNIKDAENYKHIEVKEGEKLHIVKHSETALLNTSFEAVLYNKKDTLCCSVISSMVDPVGHGDYVLDIINGNVIKTSKSHFLYSSLSILSPTVASLYLTNNNPLFSDYKSSLYHILSAIGDASLVLGILSYNDVYESGSSSKPIGNLTLGLAGLSRVVSLIFNGYVTEYNGYSFKSRGNGK